MERKKKQISNISGSQVYKILATIRQWHWWLWIEQQFAAFDLRALGFQDLTPKNVNIVKAIWFYTEAIVKS